MLLPPDSVLLPISSGALLVSRTHATFCPVRHDQLATVRDALGGRSTDLDETLRATLDRHGFFVPPRPAPRLQPKVQLQLTNACNLRCSYCCTDSGTARGRELDLAGWCAVVDEARVSFGRDVAFGILGGEPLLVPFASDVAEYILSFESPLTLYTNGTGLADAATARRVAGLAQRGAMVRVSLAGVTRQSCDARSGAARFDLALAGLAELARWGARARVDLMLFPEEVDSVASHLVELRRRLPPGTRLSLGLAFHGGREVGRHVFSSRAELEAALDCIALESGEAIAAPIRGPVVARREACACAFGATLNVRSDGALFACFRMQEPAGDLRRDGFARVAAALKANPRPASAFEPCASCPLATLCGGGCRSDNLLFSGHPERPVCGPWRVRVLCELLAEDRIGCLEWPTVHLAAEARLRGIEAPDIQLPAQMSRWDTAIAQ